MTTIDQIATKIIKEQELIIGPLAWDEARKVTGIHVINPSTGELTIDNGNEKQVVDNLVSQYEHLFGRASREVCKEAVASMVADLPKEDVPSSLM